MYVTYELYSRHGTKLVTYRNPTEALRILTMADTANMGITLKQQVHRTLNDYSPEELIETWETWQDYIATCHPGSDRDEVLAEGYSDAAAEVSKRYTELTGRSILDDSMEE